MTFVYKTLFQEMIKDCEKGEKYNKDIGHSIKL